MKRWSWCPTGEAGVMKEVTWVGQRGNTISSPSESRKWEFSIVPSTNLYWMVKLFAWRWVDLISSLVQGPGCPCLWKFATVKPGFFSFLSFSFKAIPFVQIILKLMNGQLSDIWTIVELPSACGVWVETPKKCVHASQWHAPLWKWIKPGKQGDLQTSLPLHKERTFISENNYFPVILIHPPCVRFDCFGQELFFHWSEGVSAHLQEEPGNGRWTNFHSFSSEITLWGITGFSSIFYTSPHQVGVISPCSFPLSITFAGLL